MSTKHLILLLFFYSIFSSGQVDRIEKNRTKTNSSRNYQSVTFNGIWSWFSDPRAVYFEGKYKRTYIGWVDNFGDIIVAYYDHSTKKITSKVVYDNLEIDDHNNPSILINENGHLLVFFNTHSQEGKPLYLIKSKKPESIEDWQPIKELFLNDNSYYKNAKISNHTYTNPVSLSAENNKIFLFWRGINNKPTYSISNDNGETWSPGRILFMPNENSTIRVPYTKVFSDGISKIHFTFTDGHPSKENYNALYYMYYEAGSFYKANGEKIKDIDQLPIKQDEIDLVFKHKLINNTVWNWDVAENKNGNPILVYTVFPDKKNHLYCYAIWKNNKWNNYNLVNSGNSFVEFDSTNKSKEPNYSGGIAIDHNNPNTLYLSLKKNDIFEIEKWTTTNNGESWSSKNITNNSSKNNIRPFVIRNYKEENKPNLLWLQSTTYKYYSLISKDHNSILNFNDRYQTAVKMDIKYPETNQKPSKKGLIDISRELLDWQLENPNYNMKKSNYKHGLFLDGINAYYSITKENRYKNEILNKFQYEEEEENEALALVDQIWCTSNNSNRLYTKKINTISIKDITGIDENIRLITLSKLLNQINEDDSIYKKNLKKLQLEYINKVSDAEIDIKNSNNIYANTLSIYNIAKNINDGLISISRKNKAIKLWQAVTQNLIQRKQNNLKFDIGITGAYLLASKEVFQLLKE